MKIETYHLWKHEVKFSGPFGEKSIPVSKIFFNLTESRGYFDINTMLIANLSDFNFINFFNGTDHFNIEIIPSSPDNCSGVHEKIENVHITKTILLSNYNHTLSYRHFFDNRVFFEATLEE